MKEPELLRALTKDEAAYQKRQERRRRKLERAIVRNLHIYKDVTLTDLLNMATYEDLEALEDLRTEHAAEMSAIINGTEDDDARAEARKVQQAGEELIRDRGPRRLDIAGAAALLPLIVFYASGAADMTTHLKRVAARSIDAAQKKAAEKHIQPAPEPVKVDPDAIIKETVLTPWKDKKGFTTRMITRMGANKERILTDLGQRLARGDSYDSITDDMAKIIGKKSEADCYKLIYTEGTHALNEASARVFEAEGEERYKISTVGDKRVCPICLDLEDQEFEFKYRIPGANFPPLHTCCRCSFEVL